jgi:hypothetical protein
MLDDLRRVATWVGGAPLPIGHRLLRALDRVERSLGLVRDPRIPPRPLNYNQYQSLYWWKYVREFTEESVEREVPFLIGNCGLTPTSAILDYGCGLGRSAYALSNYLSAQGQYPSIGNFSTLRRRSPRPWPWPHHIICHSQTLAPPRAAATAGSRSSRKTPRFRADRRQWRARVEAH